VVSSTRTHVRDRLDLIHVKKNRNALKKLSGEIAEFYFFHDLFSFWRQKFLRPSKRLTDFSASQRATTALKRNPLSWNFCFSKRE
jgi:hypothetical protein